MAHIPTSTMPSSLDDDVSDLMSIIANMEERVPATAHEAREINVEKAVAEKPFVRIVEEPATNLYRFRYKSEGGTAGTIPGEKQRNGRKSFPKIQVCNHEGMAALEVCCLTEDLKVHPNVLVSIITTSEKKISKHFYFHRLFNIYLLAKWSFSYFYVQ